MAKKLTNNLGLKILALLVSAILWFIAININDPISQQSFSVNVQIENLDKLENSGKYVEVKPGTDTAKVTVFATRSDLKNINEKAFTAVADVDNYNEEDGTVPIVVKLNKPYDDMKIDENFSKVQLFVENIRRRQLPISVEVQGEPDENYMLGGTGTAQNAVMLSGPESLISSVNSVSVDIDIEGATSDVNISLPIHLYDVDGKEISDSRINQSISNVSTTANILLIKGLPIEYSYVGEPAEGYQIAGNLQAGINYITVAGKSSVLKNISKIDISDALDITGANATVESYIDLKKRLPEGIVFADPEDETRTSVSVRINRIPEAVEEGEEANE